MSDLDTPTSGWFLQWVMKEKLVQVNGKALYVQRMVQHDNTFRKHTEMEKYTTGKITFDCEYEKNMKI